MEFRTGPKPNWIDVTKCEACGYWHVPGEHNCLVNIKKDLEKEADENIVRE